MEPIKHRIAHYWSHRAKDFQDQRIREFFSDKHQLWLNEIGPYLPGKETLRVLDVGTGTGFFSFLMAAEGHDAVGIDLTEEMIEGAERTSEILGLNARFIVMDAEDPDFEKESFDVILTRNLTWALPHMERAYRHWYRLLAPGGVMINFDADYCNRAEECMDEELPPEHAHNQISMEMMRENDAITMALAAYQQPRPQWDVQLLAEAGFEKILVDTAVYKRVYRTIDEFYNPAPVFAVVAYK